MAQREQIDDIGAEFWAEVFHRDLLRNRGRRSLLAISQEAGVPFSSLRRWVTRLILPPSEQVARRVGRTCGMIDQEVLDFYDRAAVQAMGWFRERPSDLRGYLAKVG